MHWFVSGFDVVGRFSADRVSINRIGAQHVSASHRKIVSVTT